ncbi:MAG: HAMP domain-containing protein [Lachnospiraceae bacterium]|nr:HAMP domain-containing protein [Lachnospiraceae bacterium]
MKKTLYIKLLLSYLLFGIIGFIVISTAISYFSMEYVKKHEASMLYREANLIASDYAISYYSNDITLADFEERIEALDTYLSAQIWVVDTNGDILVNSEKKTDLLNLENIEGFDIRDFGNQYHKTGTFYDKFAEEQISVYAPISINYRVRGYVFIHKPLQKLYTFSNGVLNISYMTLAMLFICALILLGVLVFTIILPIKKVTKAANEYISGNFDHPVDIHTDDEIGYLAASLTYMANELNTLEEDQRKFVSNVSHDFRSPLTSIKGYVEAMLDGTIPVENQEKYLNIILFETERLNKLTKSLLELNKYGNRGMMLDITTFDINNTIKMTVRTFEGICMEKRISFELILTGQTLFVRADMSKIQQVIYNLIDNAIKFSHSDSTITIETTLKNKKIFVSVKDSGIGIPKDSLSKIWERFYKSDLSRGKDKKGTGLGLSIVKEIIQAHKENINVISTEGVGTEFIFSLPFYQPEDED